MDNSEEYFKNLNEVTFELIEALVDDKIPNDGGNNMCRAIEQMKKHALEEGISQGISQGKAETLYELTHRGKLDKETAANMLNISIAEYSNKEAAFFNK